MYGLEHAGIGRYVENLVKHLAERRDFKLVLFVRKKKRGQIGLRCSRHLEIVEADFPHYSFREQIFLPFVLYKAHCDLIHFPHFNVPFFYFKPFVVTIHDLIKHESRGRQTTTRFPLLYWLKYLGYLFLMWWTVKRAKKIVVPSNFVKEKLLASYHLDPQKVVVIYEGGERVGKSQIPNPKSQKETLRKYRIKKPYLLYVGSVYPHKNVERLIEAVKLVNKKQKTENKKQVQLVIVCGRSVFWERLKAKVKKMEAEKWVNLVGFVPDDDLVILYQNAQAFVFPSLSEGFGLPGLEAMACGCPVLCSDIPVFREIYGEVALYCDPLDVRDIVVKIEQVMSQPSLRKKLIKKGWQQTKKYSWQKMTEKTVKVYKSCFG